MAVPSDPSITTICTEGLKRGGRRNPSAAEISEAEDLYLKSAKSRIQRLVKTHPLMKVRTYDATVKGQRTYSYPSDLRTPFYVKLLDGPTDHRGTAQAGASTTITLAATFSGASDAIIGRRVLITGGTGADQLREIVDYNDTTKVATVHSAWSTNPDSSSTYLVVNDEVPLWEDSPHPEAWYERYGSVIQRPTSGSFEGEEFILNYAPDKIYGLEYCYYTDLDRLDETGSAFVKILREGHDLWVQAIAVETAQRFDDERYIAELSVLQNMLTEQAAEALETYEIQYVDV